MSSIPFPSGSVMKTIRTSPPLGEGRRSGCHLTVPSVDDPIDRRVDVGHLDARWLILIDIDT
jgi:hypothetical protein